MSDLATPRSLNHAGITVADIDALVARRVAAGGKQRTEVWAFVHGADRKPCYCEDPFGNVFEIFFEDMPC